jgi:hypothetical protein
LFLGLRGIMTIRDRALYHRRWNPSPDFCGRYVDAAALRLCFGKFDGSELQDVPDWYLLWCLTTLDLIHQERRAIEIRLHQTPNKSVFLASDPMAEAWREEQKQKASVTL